MGHDRDLAGNAPLVGRLLALASASFFCLTASSLSQVADDPPGQRIQKTAILPGTPVVASVCIRCEVEHHNDGQCECQWNADFEWDVAIKTQQNSKFMR